MEVKVTERLSTQLINSTAGGIIEIWPFVFSGP